MRGVSIPAWTFLREPSASSGAPSEDEPVGHSSQEAVDELDHDLPRFQHTMSSRRMAPPPVPGPSSVHNREGGRPSGNHEIQSSSSAPRRPTSPSRTRRPHSGTDEEEERPKKKKRDLNNTANGELQRVHLSANQRENATHQRHSLSNATASESGHHRRATFAGPFLSKNGRPNAGPPNHQNADKQARNGGTSSSLGKHPTPMSRAQARTARPSTQSASARGPIAGPSRAGRRSPNSGHERPGASASAAQLTLSQRRKSAFSPGNVIDLTEDPPEAPVISQAGRPASAPAIPPPHEVIEILDSDEEPPPPPPPVSETSGKIIKAEPRASASSGRTLPRRNKEPPKRISPGCVIVLDSSDDDDPPARISVPQRDSRSTQQKEHPPDQQKASLPALSSLIECKMSPPASPPLWNEAQLPNDPMPLSPPLPPERPASPTVKPPPLEDVDMVGDVTVASDVEGVSAPVDFDVEEGGSRSTLGEVLRPSPQAIQEPVPTVSPAVDSLVNVSASFDEELPEARDSRNSEHATASQPESEHRAGVFLSAESVLWDEGSTLCGASPYEVKMHSISQTSLSEAAVQPPPVLSVASSSTAVASSRAETASPVSRVLDPGLQGLVITEGTPESTDLARSASGFSSSSGITMSTLSSPGAASRKRSLKPVDRSPWKMHGTAHSGPTGWFNHNRLSQRRRSRSQSGLQNRLSKSPVPHSPLAARSTSSLTISTTVGASPREPLQESPKAATPAVDTPHLSKKDVGAEVNASLSSRPMQSRQDSDENLLGMPVLQAVNLDAAPGVQSDMSQQRAAQSPKPHAMSEEGQALSEARVTEMSKSDDTDGRSTTPSADNPPPGPLGPTLSQIIRNAQNENARRNVIDLTFDKSDDDRGAISPGNLYDKPESPSSTDGPPWASSVAGKIAISLAPSTPSTVRTIDFSSIRKDRKVHLRTPQLLQSSPVTAPVKGPVKVTIPPLPRNIRRVSAPDALKSPPLVPVTQPSATVSRSAVQASGSSGASVYGSESSSVPIVTPASPAPLRPSLPRRPQAMRTQSTSSRNLDAPRISAPPLASASVTEDRMILDNSGTSTSVRVAPSSLTMPSNVESPPQSESPHTDATEEEECRSLIYPSTTPEESPEVEVPDEDEFPIRSLAGRRTRSQASSEPSSGPRRSARLSSSSAGSSVEPEELSRPRLRRRERVAIRTHSDEEIASHGGIPRFPTRYSRAFEAAGFESLSWKKDRQRVAKEFAPVTQSADNIPHDLHDRLNALPPSARHASNLQAIFEAEIDANTAEDEPNAPPIRVINEVDDEPTPPMEFYYSNLMWHSADVPKPDFDALKGCGCIGACNQNSKTCACVRRQREHCQGQFNFLYDQKGRLKLHDYPIFECNINCGCSDDCPNRVIQHGRRYEIAIRKTASKGWGIFAGPKKIPAMSFLGVYAGEYLTDEAAERRGLRYNSFGRTYLFDLDFYHIQKNEDDSPKYTVDAYHAGNFTRYLNHSCDPNCKIVPGYINESNIEKPLLTIFTIRDVEPFEELCFDYNGSDDEKVDPDKDGAVYVQCQCGAAKCKGYVWK